jgi:membrane-associated protein
MDWLTSLVDLMNHLDLRMDNAIGHYGALVYALLFLIIFGETGFVVLPFLPGDSLLFAVGAKSSMGILDVETTLLLLILAAFTGNMVNYGIGWFIGPKMFRREKGKLFRKEGLERTHAFFNKYGGVTIVISRFVPIVRSFAPFVAGIGRMPLTRFFLFNLIGASLWVSAFVSLGYFFGKVPIVRDNYILGTLTLLLASLILIPIIFQIVHKVQGKKKSEPNDHQEN